MMASLLVARRKLELFAVEAADAMLADVLQQLPNLTVCQTVLCGRHRHIHVHARSVPSTFVQQYSMQCGQGLGGCRGATPKLSRFFYLVRTWMS
jgi:hypothetical protein